MKNKKEFVVPRVLQICEVMLERDLLGPSQDFMQSSNVETTGHQIEEHTTHQNSDWGNGGTWLD